MLLRTVAGGNQAALEEWLQTASPEGVYSINGGMVHYSNAITSLFSERHTILKMLKSAEEAQVKDVSK